MMLAVVGRGQGVNASMQLTNQNNEPNSPLKELRYEIIQCIVTNDEEICKQEKYRKTLLKTSQTK